MSSNGNVDSSMLKMLSGDANDVVLKLSARVNRDTCLIKPSKREMGDTNNISLMNS